jgi:H+-translocating NAD(P) transhydrogenase subunit alpha
MKTISRTTAAAASLLTALILMGMPGCGSNETAPTKPTATDAKPADMPVAENPAPVPTATPSTIPGPPAPGGETPSVGKPGIPNPTDVTPAVPAMPTPIEPSAAQKAAISPVPAPAAKSAAEPMKVVDYSSLLFVFMLATFIGLGVIMRVSRLLHTPLMSITNAISAIAVVGSIIVVGEENNPWGVRLLGAIALFASMTNIVSGFLITDRMLKMFKSPGDGGKR